MWHMWLNGDEQWQNHKIVKKRKHNLKPESDPEPKSEGLVIPKGTVTIIEQTAIYNAVETIDEAWIVIESVDEESSDKESEEWIVI